MTKTKNHRRNVLNKLNVIYKDPLKLLLWKIYRRSFKQEPNSVNVKSAFTLKTTNLVAFTHNLNVYRYFKHCQLIWDYNLLYYYYFCTSLQALWGILPRGNHRLLPYAEQNHVQRSLTAELRALWNWRYLWSDVSDYLSDFYDLRVVSFTALTQSVLIAEGGGPAGLKCPWGSLNPGEGRRCIFSGKAMGREWFGETGSPFR